MRCLLFILCIFFLSLHPKAQDLHALLKQADSLEAIPSEKAALDKFKSALKLDPLNLYALVKCSELCSRVGAREADNRSRDSYYQAAIIYAQTALKLHPENDEANVVMGLAVGRTVLIKSGKEKIRAVKEIKMYADNALKINPNNFKAWHIIGKWNYEVSNLSFVERAATKVFYGGLPNASLKASINAYEKARSLSPAFLLNFLELANAYHRNNEDEKAITILKTLLTLPSKTEDDPRIKVNASDLIKKWQ